MQQPQLDHQPPLPFGPPQKHRQQAALLLEAVLNEAIEPRVAINRWPENHGLEDPSLDCAYQVLWHFESDETQQKTEIFYMDAQLELIRQVANALKANQDLPDHILYTYLKQTPVRFYYPRSFWGASLQAAQTLLQESLRIVTRAWALLPQQR